MAILMARRRCSVIHLGCSDRFVPDIVCARGGDYRGECTSGPEDQQGSEHGDEGGEDEQQRVRRTPAVQRGAAARSAEDRTAQVPRARVGRVRARNDPEEQTDHRLRGRKILRPGRARRGRSVTSNRATSGASRSIATGRSTRRSTATRRASSTTGCRGNCYVQIIKGVIWIRAARTIRKGEELLYNYNTEGAAEIPCRCRPGCQGML